MEAMQAELDQIEVEGTSGGGLVTVKLSGKGEMKGVKIDDTLMQPPEKEILEDLIVAAHADARRKAETLLQEKMQSVAGGLPAAARDEIVLNRSDRWQIRRNRVGWRSAVEKNIDMQALSAAIAGFFGVSRADVPLPGAGRSGRQRPLHRLSRDRDGGKWLPASRTSAPCSACVS